MDNKELDFVLEEDKEMLQNLVEVLRIFIQEGVIYNRNKHITFFGENSFVDNLSETSLVDIPKPSLKKSVSYVHNFIFFTKQRAIKSSSFLCSFNKDFASGIKGRYSSKGTNAIFENNSSESSLNSCSDKEDLFNISCLWFKRSLQKYLNFSKRTLKERNLAFTAFANFAKRFIQSSLENSCFNLNGAKIDRLLLKNMGIISPCEISVLNNTFASMTNLIYISPSFFKVLCIRDLIFSDSSSASFSVNFDFDIIFLNNFSFIAVSDIALRAISDQFISGNDSISCFNSLGIDSVSVGIIYRAIINALNYVYYLQVFKSLFSKEEVIKNEQS